MAKVSILGDGGWGTALALVLLDSGSDVTIWSPFPEYAEKMRATRKNPKFLPQARIPDPIGITADYKDIKDAEVLLSVIPTKFLREVMEGFKPFYGSAPIISASKGIEQESLLTATGVIQDVLGACPVAVISGPSHAEEVVQKMPTTVVSASSDEALAKMTQGLFNTESFRVYTHNDIKGVELGGALKNVVSIAAGIVDGLKFGANTKTALVTRGIVEMGRLGQALGASRSTFFGLSGIGDLMVSCFSPFGRNRFVGEQLGQGKKIQEIVEAMDMVAEGVATSKGVKVLMDQHQVEMPICGEIYKVLYDNKSPAIAVKDLMKRQLKNEVEW